MTGAYNFNGHEVERVQSVRKRPGMYIGSVGASGLLQLIWEVFDNSLDEAMNGHATTIEVTIHADGKAITVKDDGPGIPVDVVSGNNKTFLEIAFTELKSNFVIESQTYKSVGGLHGIGACVVSALSKKAVVRVHRDGKAWEQAFCRGVAKGPLMKVDDSSFVGTSVYFEPDPEIFPKIEFDPDVVRKHLQVAAYLHEGIQITFVDERRKIREAFIHEHGLVDFLKALISDQNLHSLHDSPFIYSNSGKSPSFKVGVSLSWTDSTDEHIESFINGLPTKSGGTHEAGIRSAVSKAVRRHMKKSGLPADIEIDTDDIRQGIVCVLSVLMVTPSFEGPTKDRLGSPEVKYLVEGAVRPALEEWLRENKPEAEVIVTRIIEASRSRADVARLKKTKASGSH